VIDTWRTPFEKFWLKNDFRWVSVTLSPHNIRH
jgi:hypothetical protein